MIKSKQRAVYEAQLATASRALWRAVEAAEVAGDPGAAEEVTELRTQISNLMSASVNGQRRPRRKLPLSLDDCT